MVHDPERKCATVIDIYFTKTQTLRLATSYIDYLMTLLNSDPNNAEFIDDFKVDIHKKWNEKTEEQKRRELVSFHKIDTNANDIEFTCSCKRKSLALSFV